MKRFFYEFVLCCIMIFNSTTSFSKEVILPKPNGSYSVGTRALVFQDNSRTLLRGSGPRRWMGQVFYPSQKHETREPYMPGTLENGMISGVQVLSHSQVNAEPIRGIRFSLILFIPGLGEERQKYTILLEECASHGFVVLSCDQPHVANFVRFPNGEKIVLTTQDAWNIPRNRDYRYEYYDEAMRFAIEDMQYLLSNLNTVERDTGLLFDKNKITLMGHSFGGNVAHTLGFTETRVHKVVDIDSKITERKIYGHIGVPPNSFKKPILFIRGMLQYQESVGDQLQKIANATLWGPQVQHSAFSDQAYIGAMIPEISNPNLFSLLFNWVFKRGPVFSAIDTQLGTQSVDEWFHEYRKLIMKWLFKYN